MAARNFHILRILQFSVFSGGGRTNDIMDLRERPQKLVRQMDAIVQLAQKHRVAILLSLHDWTPLELTDEQLAAEADWNRFWAGRYREVPGIFYDIQNEPSVGTPDSPHVVALWNQWLAGKYGSDQALARAWWKRPPEAALPNVAIGGANDDWEDVRSADLKRFEVELLNRWVRVNVDSVRAGDPDALICVGYAPWVRPVYSMLGNRDTSFSNMHFYGDEGGFASEFRLSDRRFDGKGMTLGECGAQEAHDARIQGSDDLHAEASLRRFQTYIHYGVGLGGAFICNWSWKEMDETVFPWGLMQHNASVAKPWLHAWEQGSLLLATVAPAYESPRVWVLAPDKNRIGPHCDQMQDALKRSFDLLLDQRVDFGVINDEDLERLPASAAAIVWPLPYCPEDATFDRVHAWVKAGGTLYLSGDVAYGPTRRPDRPQRRTAVGLPSLQPADPFHTPDDRWHAAPLEAQVGAGRVLYVPYPLELREQGSDPQVYGRFLQMAGISSIPVDPADAPVRVLTVPTEDQGRIYVLARTGGTMRLLSVTVPAQGGSGPAPGPAAAVTVELARDGFAFVVVGPQGQVRAVESQGAVRIGDVDVASAAGHYGLCALDGGDLRDSRQVMVLPHQCTEVRTPGLPAATAGETWSGRLLDAGAEGGTRTQGSGVLTFPPVPGHIAVVAQGGELTAALQAVERLRLLKWQE